MKYNVWYRISPSFRMDLKLTAENLDRTHRLVKVALEADSPDEVFSAMQGERWSPNGEARFLIESLGLRHTSMSVGDVIEDPESGTIYEAGMAGWRTIEQDSVASIGQALSGDWA